MKKWVVCEPGGGIFQGECLGLLFCYSGPDSDLDAEEILYFDTKEEAQNCIAKIVSVAEGCNSRSIETLKRMWVAEITPDTDIEVLAKTVYES